MEKICDKKDCFGCFACKNICPKDAITFVEGDLGAVVPNIDQTKCIDCNLCVKVCPALNKSKFYKPMKTYAAIAKNKKIYETSTSGGVATVLSKQIIEDDGVVYGAAFTDWVTVKHIRVDNVEDLKKLQGSKYVQSHINNTYQSVKQDLLQNKKVLFIGTPCQVDGLLMYLRKSYDNLYTVNIICHGVPSQKLLKDNFNFKNTKDLKLSFRTQTGYYMTVKDNNNLLYKKIFYKDLYFLCFMRKIIFRESCYSCKYAQQNRVGDITIGDFWGFNKNKPFIVDADLGLSTILVNTDKGMNLIESSNEALYLQERLLEEAVNGNPQLKYPSKRHRNSEKFKKIYEKNGFKAACKYTLFIDQIGYKLIFLKQRIFAKKP